MPTSNNTDKIIVHVNQEVIRHNAKYSTRYPSLVIWWPKQMGFNQNIWYAHEVQGNAHLKDAFYEGVPCLVTGARVWMEFNYTSDWAIHGPTWDHSHFCDILKEEHNYELAGSIEKTFGRFC